jgi:methionyl-tRNA formyltransferase
MSFNPSVVFFGTPEFAVPSLEILHKNNIDVKAVVTVPDKPAGRGQKINTSPVKDFAVANDLKIFQPPNLKDPVFFEELRQLKAHIFVVVAFRMLPESIWNMALLGTFNLHASLLPQYRGAAPINWAIINGEKETGVTTFFIAEQVDTGKIIYREQTMIGKNETAGDLHDRLMQTGASLVLKTVKSIADNTIHTIDQSDLSKGKELKPAPKLTKQNTKIDIRKSPDELTNFIHGLNPYPTAHGHLSNKNGISFSIKIFDAVPTIEKHSYPAGKVTTDNRSFMRIYLPGGYVDVTDLQLAGKNRMLIKDFLNGQKMEGEWFLE